MSAEHQVFGDWRDLRGAIDRAFPEYIGGNIPEDLWNTCQAILAEYRPLRVKCGPFGCGEIISWNRAYRCADCNAVYCEACIKPHFGPNHRSHA